MRMDNKRNHYKMDAIGLISILKKKLFICLFYYKDWTIHKEGLLLLGLSNSTLHDRGFRLCLLRTPNGGFCSHTHITHRPKTYTDHYITTLSLDTDVSPFLI